LGRVFDSRRATGNDQGYDQEQGAWKSHDSIGHEALLPFGFHCQVFMVVRKLTRQDLDRYVTVEFGVGGAIDFADASLAEIGGDLAMSDGLIDHDVSFRRLALALIGILILQP
jgi:hypothetical protein